MRIESSIVDREIEKAITMLVGCVRENCTNSKPLILHSIRVGMKLLDLKRPKETVIAGFLHDLIEDTDCQIEDIEKQVGSKVAILVIALTQEDIKDYKERWNVLLNKVKKVGKEAMIIKIIDNNDNLIHFASLIKDKCVLTETFWKWGFTIEFLQPYIGNLDIFKKHHDNYKNLKSKLLSC